MDALPSRGFTAASSARSSTFFTGISTMSSGLANLKRHASPEEIISDSADILGGAVAVVLGAPFYIFEKTFKYAVNKDKK